MTPKFSLKQLRNIFLSCAILLIVFTLGYKAGAKEGVRGVVYSKQDIAGTEPSKDVQVDFSLFWDVWERVSREYYDKTAIDPQKMVYGAISGMVAALGDPYTVFLPPAQNKETKDDLGGRFEGIGAQLGVKDKKIVIVAPLKDSPAEKAGLKAGDWIVKVDGKDTLDWTLPETVSKIRGEKGTKVLLSIFHKDDTKPTDVEVVRDAISVSSVEWSMKNVQCAHDGCKEIEGSCSGCTSVVYLKLARFGDQTSEEWAKAISEIQAGIRSTPAKGLVFDLRNNPGGYLTGSVFIASEFLSDGTVVTQENANGTKQTFTVNRKGQMLTIPMVVLINKGSASASEIVAGAVQDRGRARLVGETSFGKGSIQEALDLEKGAGIHITTAKWLTPSGRWIHGKGLEPDIKVESDENQPDVDVQLEKAMEVLVK